MTDKPTDAELKALWQLHAADIGGIFHYARAVLSKWGQPAQAAEPVAYSIGNTLKWHEGKGLTNAQLFAAPQPAAREPLSDEQIKDGHTGMPRDVWAFADGVRFAEQHHGIKGGKHHSKANTAAPARLDNK